MGGLKRKIQSLWHSLFRGMAAADSVMQAPSISNGVEIRQTIGGGGVFNDMLEEKETQRVVEMRDTYYRVLKEADKYDVSSIKMSVDENGEVTFRNTDSAKKKTYSDFIKHAPVYETDGYTLRTIQDNKHIVNRTSFDPSNINEAMKEGLYAYDTTLTVTRDNFIPRFEIDKFVTKMVARNQDGTNRAIVDFYMPTVASQFGKIDAILIANINEMMNSKNYRSDIVDFSTIEWVSDKAWNSDDICHFKYNDIHLVDINIFDGSFVLSFNCHIVSDGVYLAEKYKTEELSKKYAEEAPKTDSPDIFAIERREKRRETKKNEVDITDLGPTTIRLS